MKFLYIIIYMLGAALPIVAAGHDAKAAELEEKGSESFRHEQYSDAVDYYMQSMAQARATGDTHTHCADLNGIGMVYVRLNDLERALHYFNKSYDLAVKSGDRDLQARNVAHMVSVYCFNAQLDEARHFYTIQQTFPAKGNELLEYYDLFNSALIAQLEDRLDDAARLYKQAIAYANTHQMDDKYISADYGLLVFVYLQQGDIETARDFCEKYRQYAEKMQTRTAWKSYYEMLVAVHTAAHDEERAQSCQRTADSLSVAIINQAQIDAVDNKIVKFEMGLNEEDLDAMSSIISRQWLTIVLAVLFIVILAAFVAVVAVKNRHLRQAQQLLVKKNEELMKAEQRSSRLLDQHYQQEQAPPTNATPDNHAEVPLTQEQIDTMLSRIVGVMSNVGIISQPDFTLARLAQMVDSNTKYVSWVINNVYQKNFKSYLNEHRIREACRRLEDEEHYGRLTIQAVYKDLGYSSASNFIQAFKTVTGVTPSTYQKLAKESQQAPQASPF